MPLKRKEMKKSLTCLSLTLLSSNISPKKREEGRKMKRASFTCHLLYSTAFLAFNFQNFCQMLEMAGIPWKVKGGEREGGPLCHTYIQEIAMNRYIQGRRAFFNNKPYTKLQFWTNDQG